MQEMFCFQCQQTAHNTGCDGKAGVCGKKADTANYQDEVIGALIGLAQAVQAGTATDRTDELMLKGLFTTITNVNFNNETILQIKNDIEKEKAAVSTTHFADYDMAELWQAGEDVRSLKSLILFGLKGMAAYAYHARALGKTDPAVNRYFYEALAALGEEKSPNDLLKLVLKTGEVNLACMALLDAANTEAYGDPVPVTVPLTIEKGPFIVVSGHDLHDLKLLLEQTEGKGINIYTHSEMLPAHGYPELKKYPHLKGNFGTGWQNQQTEFHNIPAPILFTTNCLMPVRQSYCDRVFTTSVVSYPEIPHIGADKDFTPVIEKALECGGYPEDHPMTGMNGGHTVTTGFARNAVLAHAGEIVQLVKSGKIRHIFLIGGCDGAAPSRSYYTDFARMTPADTLILTLACGKYRLNADQSAAGPGHRPAGRNAADLPPDVGFAGEGLLHLRDRQNHRFQRAERPYPHPPRTRHATEILCGAGGVRALFSYHFKGGSRHETDLVCIVWVAFGRGAGRVQRAG